MTLRQLTLFSLFPLMIMSFSAAAETNGSQTPPPSTQSKDLNNRKMDNMMMELQKVQGCIAKVNLDEIDKLTEQANKIQQQTVHLCQQGKRDEAQKKIMDYAKKINSNENVKKMKNCLKGIDNPRLREQFDRDLEVDTKKHVCDLIDNYTTAP